MKRARFVAAARLEYLAEIIYYTEAQPGVGGRFAQAVEDGTITQEHADWLLEGLEKGFLGGHGGFGFGHGPKVEGPFGPQNQSDGN